MKRKYRDLEDRLLSLSILELETGCWQWIGQFNRFGYPRLCLWTPRGPRNFMAYKLSLNVLCGLVIPQLLQVDHKCRNKACINPLHLEIVTRQENLDRRVYK